MDNNTYDDLNYLVEKTAIALNFVSLSNRAEVYQQIIRDNVVESIRDIVTNSNENIFILMEELHDKYAKIYSDFTVENIDSLIFSAVNNPEILASLEDDLAKFIEDFSNASEKLHYIWENEYVLPTDLDNIIGQFIQDKYNQNLKQELYFTINKAKCVLALLNKADQILKEIDNVNVAPEILEKNIILEVAHNYYNEFRNIDYSLIEGFKNETLIDNIIYPLVSNKKNELGIAIDYVKQIEVELLGLVEDELV